MYATDPIDIDTDGHFTADKDDYAIQVLIPDMNTADRSEFDGFQGPAMGQTLKLVFTKEAGIKNPSEAGSHSVGYSVLGPNDPQNNGPQKKDGDIRIYDDGSLTEEYAPLKTVAKISLSDVDNTRGYELTVTGSGFNNGTSAAVHVLHKPDSEWSVSVVQKWWDSLDCDRRNAVVGKTGANVDAPDEGYCNVVEDGSDFIGLSDDQETVVKRAAQLLLPSADHHCRAGIATVGSDDTVAVEFEVTVPIFGPGQTNYICMVDGEGRSSSTDVEDFKLEPSIRVSPASASVGDTINVFAQDYPNTGASLTSLKIANQEVAAPRPDQRLLRQHQQRRFGDRHL